MVLRPTRLVPLAASLVASGLATWLTLSLSHQLYQRLPVLPWTGVPVLLGVAVIEAGAGRELRRRIRRSPGTRPADPLLTARMAVLAKATALTAALVTGICAGFAAYLAGRLTAPGPRHDLVTILVTAGSALIAAGAALYLERCCRIPELSGHPRTLVTLRRFRTTHCGRNPILYARGRLQNVPSGRSSGYRDRDGRAGRRHG